MSNSEVRLSTINLGNQLEDSILAHNRCTSNRFGHICSTNPFLLTYCNLYSSRSLRRGCFRSRRLVWHLEATNRLARDPSPKSRRNVETL